MLLITIAILISHHSRNVDPMIPKRNDRYPQGGSIAGRPEVESPKQQQQSPLGPQVGPAPGFGRGSPVGGVFDGPNNKRRRY